MAASQERIIQTARITSLFGGDSVVFHPAYYLKDDPSQVYASVKSNLEQIVTKLKKEGIRVWLRPEVMGKDSQFGTLEEILQLCTEVEAGSGRFRTWLCSRRDIQLALVPAGAICNDGPAFRSQYRQ